MIQDRRANKGPYRHVDVVSIRGLIGTSSTCAYHLPTGVESRPRLWFESDAPAKDLKLPDCLDWFYDRGFDVGNIDRQPNKERYSISTSSCVRFRPCDMLLSNL